MKQNRQKWDEYYEKERRALNTRKKSLDDLKLDFNPEIICEPGRALVAESGSTIVRVNLRKKQKLYINIKKTARRAPFSVDHVANIHFENNLL